jgi:hypothetical protein
MANRSVSSVSAAVLTLTSSCVALMAFTVPSPPAGRIMRRSRTWLCHQTHRHCLLASASVRWRHSSTTSVAAQDAMGPGRAHLTDRGLLTMGVSAPRHPASGGGPMSDQPAPSERGVSPAQVWPTRATEGQPRVGWLLAPRAFHLVIAQVECNPQEVAPAARSARPPQNAAGSPRPTGPHVRPPVHPAPRACQHRQHRTAV